MRRVSFYSGAEVSRSFSFEENAGTHLGTGFAFAHGVKALKMQMRGESIDLSESGGLHRAQPEA